MRLAPLGLILCLTLAACGDPLRDVPRLADQDVLEAIGQADVLGGPPPETIAQTITRTAPEDVPEVVPESAPPRGGLLGMLRGRALAATADAAAPEITENAIAENAEQGEAVATPVAEIAPAVAAAPEPAPRRGLLARLRGGSGTAPVAEAAPVETALAVPEAPAAPDASAEPVPEPAPEPAPEPRTEPVRRGLFGGARAGGSADALSPDAPDYQLVSPGMSLPYGQVGRLCGTPVNRLGPAVARHPARGRGWTLHDSEPGSTGPRTFWLTGFSDGCARQFTAALVLFGPVESYEAIRYSPAGKTLPVSETDRAYEALKSRLCRVGKGKPCGDRIGRMGDAVFVSVYERFGSNPRWKDVLLHDGRVVALDVKTR